MKKQFSLKLLAVCLFSFSVGIITESCNSSSIREECAKVIVDDIQRPNFVNISVDTSPDQYDRIVWYLPSGEKLSQISAITVYFPKKGVYDIKIELSKGNKTTEIIKNVIIDTDDPFVINGEKLVWHDEFDGVSLNQDWWVNETDVRVNNELQKYTYGDNVSVKDGLLTITAQKVGEEQVYGDYTSGRIKTQGKKEFTYGRMEIRAKVPNGLGTWPAIWMLGGDIYATDWPACGEIDIMEHVGFNPQKVHSSLHSNSSYGNTQNTGITTVETYDTDFHIYGVNWTPDKLEFYIDSPQNIHYTYNPEVKDKATWPFDKPFFFILNIAVGGDWGGKEGIDDSIFPKDMLVDYVRVYQKNTEE